MKEENNTTYSIPEASSALQISQSTIRHLCNTGLVPHVRRGRRGQRLLAEWQLNHIRTILDLRQAGLSKAELKRYARLFREGKFTLPERKALLETQKRQLWQELEDLQRGIDILERQIELIDQSLHQKIKPKHR